MGGMTSKWGGVKGKVSLLPKHCLLQDYFAPFSKAASYNEASKTQFQIDINLNILFNIDFSF